MKNYQTIFTNRTSMMSADVNENLILGLSLKNQVKSASAQNRILRRIIEKRQAQERYRISKITVPNELEPIYWQKDLEKSQKGHIFASEFKN